jgi:hypothetical protein
MYCYPEESYISLHAKLLSKFVRQKCTGSNPKMNKKNTNCIPVYVHIDSVQNTYFAK